MRQSVTKGLYEYWNGLRGARAAPDRADVDPAAIRHLLADSFILEVDEAGRFPIRLCGTRLSALFLDDVKGRSFLELWREADQHAVAAAISTVLDGATPVVAGGRAPSRAAAPLDLELLLLPLRHFGRTHSRILGALTPAYAPDWLGRSQTQPLIFNSLRVLGADIGRAERREAGEGVAAPFAARRGALKLTVYQGGKS